jgi:hypothetical protein
MSKYFRFFLIENMLKKNLEFLDICKNKENVFYFILFYYF